MNKKAIIEILKITLLLFAIGIFAFLFNKLFNRSSCIIYNITGVPCPSCGFATAWYNVLLGNFKNAFYYNPMFFIILLIYIPSILKLFNICPQKKWINIYFIILILILIIIWILRLYLYFPLDPMRFYEKSLIAYMTSIFNVN